MISKKLVMVRNVAVGGLLALGLSSFAITAADAKNDHSNSGGGNSGSATHGNPNDNNQSHNSGKSVSRLGALNAGHASANAFAHAAPNSRVGKIKAYFLANEAANVAAAKVVADQLAIATYNAAVAKLALDQSQTTPDPALLALDQKAIQDALAADTAALASLSADQLAANTLLATATNDLNAAANKTPVSAPTKAALDALLVGKIPVPTL